MSYHKLTVVGNLGKDPELRYTPGGQAVTGFSIASNFKYTNSDGEKISQTTWFRVSVFGRKAETTNQYLKKGSRVLVTGRLNSDKETGGPRLWTKQDGLPAGSYDVVADTVVFLDSPSTSNGNGEAESDEIPW